MYYNMATLIAILNLPEQFFILRDKGAGAYLQIKAAFEEISDNQPLILSFPPNQLVDASFADESVIRLGREVVDGNFGQKALLLSGLTEDSIHNIQAAILLQNLKLAFLAVEPSGNWRVIGRLEPSLQEVLEMLSTRKQLTAIELSSLLNLAINSASNRLKRLHDQHLVRREYEISEKGLQYIYYFWHWDKEETPKESK